MKKDLDIHLPPYEVCQTDDERFMREALREAWKAYENDEVPIGAVIVKKNQIIARGHNQVELLKDATAHAELLCITAAENAVDNWRLTDTTMYSTIEPCAMCAGAILLSRVETLIWGAPDIRHGANGSWIDVFAKNHPTHTVLIRKGILEEWCQMPLKMFFQKRRKENKDVVI
jgi:tRNA(adenine34) deaminase